MPTETARPSIRQRRRDVTVTLTNVNGATASPAGPFVGLTNASGQFTVTFTSATAGQVIGSAASNVMWAACLATRDRRHGRQFRRRREDVVDAKIIISPDGVNQVGDPHTFTVTVFADNGDGIDNDGQSWVTSIVLARGRRNRHAGRKQRRRSRCQRADQFTGSRSHHRRGGHQRASVSSRSLSLPPPLARSSARRPQMSMWVDLVLPRSTNGTGNNSGPATKTFVRPGIDMEKTTNGPTNSNPTAPDYDNEDAENGPGVPILTPGSTVTWTYKVTNTGSMDFAFNEVVVVDDNGTPGNTADDLSTPMARSRSKASRPATRTTFSSRAKSGCTRRAAPCRTSGSFRPGGHV